MNSTKWQQTELLPSEQAHVEEVTADLVARVSRKKTLLDAWNYAQEIACLEDKTVYSAINLDKSHWSKIRKGAASPPADQRFTRFMDVVQNDIPLIWLAEARGYDFLSMRRHRSSLERENEELKKEIADRDRALALIIGARR